MKPLLLSLLALSPKSIDSLAVRRLSHDSFLRPQQQQPCSRCLFAAQKNDNDQPPVSLNIEVITGNAIDEEEGKLSEADRRLSDILPPAVSFSRNSVLFSEQPVTQRNNDVLKAWRVIKSKVPPLITGAWPWRDPYLGDENPMGAVYNIFFVRLPVIAAGMIYVKNLVEGHPLIIDYGDGPFVVNPLVVFLVLALILA